MQSLQQSFRKMQFTAGSLFVKIDGPKGGTWVLKVADGTGSWVTRKLSLQKTGDKP